MAQRRGREQLARDACYDCHSNETEWPVYAYVAPMSWLVRHDVEHGRDALNFSEWGERDDAHDAAEAVEDGSMPPDRYVRLHSDARLSPAERQALIDALGPWTTAAGATAARAAVTAARVAAVTAGRAEAI